jgi:D-glycero-alpha-D-manno-heptose-7-phosphate kinase
MIIAKSPVRVSYLGGGSDVPEYFNNEPSYIVGTTINKYVYTSINPLQEFAEQKIRVTYRQVESVSKIEDVSHPIVREILKYMKWDRPINIATLADLPGNSGLGSSSAFTVSLISALNLEGNLQMTQDEIAKLAIHIEREILQEAGGVQDQYHSAIGGFRMYRFSKEGHTYSNLILDQEQSEYISDRQWIYPVGNSRSSSDTHKMINNLTIDDATKKTNVRDLSQKEHSLYKDLLDPKLDATDIYTLLAQAVKDSWELKSQQNLVSTKTIEGVIEEIYSAGADAVKLCGAGQGGFLLILAKPEVFQKHSGSFTIDWLLNARIESKGCQAFSA